MILSGTSANDTLRGSVDGDSLSGLGGADVLDGRAGADTLSGGSGNDTLVGGAGGDFVAGGTGDDLFSQAETLGDDTLRGGAGRDIFNDLYGANVLDGGDGDDEFEVNAADAGSSTVSGGAGRDIYRVAEAGADRAWLVTDFEAGAGGDLLDVDALLNASAFHGYDGGNPYAAGQGFLQLVQSGAHTLLQWDRDGGGDDWVTIITLRETAAGAVTAENIVGTLAPHGSDDPGQVLTGTAGADALAGGVFDDRLSGLGGADGLDGRAGADTLSGGSGNDILVGGAGDDSVAGGTGDDNFSATDTLGDDTLRGGAGRDIFNDFYGANVLDGGDGDDEFEVDAADAGSSTVSGGSGRDTYRMTEAEADRAWLVTDFEAGAGGDILDVDALVDASGFHGYAGGNPFAPAGFLRLAQSGDHALLQWDRDGGGDEWVTVLVLRDLDTGAIISDNLLGAIAPDGSADAGQVIVGTAAADTLAGGVFDDQLSGLVGADGLDGRAGADTLSGGSGNDTLAGGAGDDFVAGGTGDDVYAAAGSPGDDTLLGGAGRDRFHDLYGANVLDGGDGDDEFEVDVADAGSSTVSGGAGRDIYRVAEAGADRAWSVTDFEGGAGGDLLDVDALLNASGFFGFSGGNPFAAELGFLRLLQAGANTLLQWDRDGAAGGADDWVTTLVFQDFDASAITSDNFEGSLIVGTEGADSLIGGLGNDTVQGLAGDDTLDGSGGQDVLEGGSGDDLYYVEDANDLVIETDNDAPGALLLPGALVLPGSSGSGLNGVSGIIDTVRAAVNYTLATLDYVENLHLDAGASRAAGNNLANELKGNAGNDTLFGSGGNDTLDGGAGNDSMNGGSGNDLYIVNAANDLVTDASGTDTVRASVTETLASGIEKLVLTGAGAINGTGNALANTLTGNSGANVLDGGGGADALNGGGGNDTLAWSSTDSCNGGTGIDTLRLGAGALNLLAVADSKIVSVEKVDLKGDGANVLTVSQAEVLTMSSTDVLTVLGDAGDQVNAAGFAQIADLEAFNRYKSGTAILLVESDVAVVL